MKTALVFIYNSFQDPLFKGNLFKHLKIESGNGIFEFVIITFEQKEYQTTLNEEREIKNELLKLNMHWYPLKWHSGNFILLKKLYDITNAFLLILKLHFKFKPKAIISLGTISGSFSYLIKLLFSYNHFAYQHEPHSEFMKDFGIWTEESISFRMLRYFENKTAKSAEIISTGTDLMVKKLKDIGSNGLIYKLPSCADDLLFKIDSERRISIRAKLGICENHQVFIYVGKFGGIYYSDELFSVIGELNRSINNFFIIILSPNDKAWITERLQRQKIDDFYVDKVPYEKVYEYLNAADMGISAIPGLPSQKFRSPIKVGEYLLCGIPFVTNRGVSEDDLIAQKYSVGVVLDHFTKSEVKANLKEIKELLANKESSKNRQIGMEYRSLSAYTEISREIFTNL